MEMVPLQGSWHPFGSGNDAKVHLCKMIRGTGKHLCKEILRFLCILRRLSKALMVTSSMVAWGRPRLCKAPCDTTPANQQNECCKRRCPQALKVFGGTEYLEQNFHREKMILLIKTELPNNQTKELPKDLPGALKGAAGSDPRDPCGPPMYSNKGSRIVANWLPQGGEDTEKSKNPSVLLSVTGLKTSRFLCLKHFI